MRKIKFRAKIIEHKGCPTDNIGKWCYGCFVIDESRNDEFRYRMYPSKGGQLFAPPIDIETLGQYIGKTDKNGNEIYEDDVLKYQDELYLVKYYESLAMYRLKGITSDGTDGVKIQISDCEIIGNRHDDLDLIINTIMR